MTNSILAFKMSIPCITGTNMKIKAGRKCFSDTIDFALHDGTVVILTPVMLQMRMYKLTKLIEHDGSHTLTATDIDKLVDVRKKFLARVRMRRHRESRVFNTEKLERDIAASLERRSNVMDVFRNRVEEHISPEFLTPVMFVAEIALFSPDLLAPAMIAAFGHRPTTDSLPWQASGLAPVPVSPPNEI